MPSQLQVDIQRIDSIESTFFRNMVWLVYSENVSSNQIPDHYYFNLPEQGDMQAVWQWYQSIKTSIIKRPSDSLILGKYSEAIFLNYFSNHPHISWVKNNIQLIDGKQTIGEIDYLFQKNDESFVHLELAIKFYLKTTLNSKVIYLGPNAKDSFQLKINKLIEKQLQLTETHTSLLPSEFRTIPFSPKLMIKGSLFYPFNKEDQSKYSSTYGWWLSISDIEELEEPFYSYTLIAKKRDWIFPYNSRLKKYNFSAFRLLVSEQLNSLKGLMVTRFDADGFAVDRGFIVQNEWPN